MTNDKKAPERIWAHPTEREPMPARLKSHARWRRGKWKDHDSNAHGDVEYVRHDHALALAAAAVAHPQDAQAALEARDKRVREDALRDVLGKEDGCGFVSREDILALIEGDTDE